MSRSPSPTLSDSALLDSLEDSFDYSAHREARMEALSRQIKQVKDLRESEYGRIVEFNEEKALIERMAKEKYCILHFVHPNFKRCDIMDRHLSQLASKHKHTLFLRANVDNVPFLVTKMAVKVLPCVMSYVDGRAVDRLIGFEELGQSDNFTTKALEFRLSQTGVLPTDLTLATNVSASILTHKQQGSRSGSEDEDSEERDRRRGKSGIRSGFRNKRGGESGDDDW
ncbi:GTPase inhibitor [Cryptococcus neoformans]|nr:GTPase inhibitor [Cryptococcus neoformans var. grubii Bt1]OXH27214.1 GTPase inhibitor [Cryptococcus neoformans var. grubii]